MAKELKIFLVTCLLMFIVEAKPAPGNNGKGDHNDLAARGSGIEVDPSIPALINEMVGNPVHKYAAFKIVDKTRVVIDYDMLGDPAKTVTVEEDEKQFNKMKSLLTNEPRFILYDFRFTNKEGRLITKLVFIVWLSDQASISDRWLYGGALDVVREAVEGLFRLQFNDLSNLDYTTLMEEVARRA
ncbi:uncharacterized protein LOC144665393 [Oculina patagonica]